LRFSWLLQLNHIRYLLYYICGSLVLSIRKMLQQLNNQGITDAQATVMAALIAIVAGAISGYLAGQFQSKIEIEKWRRSVLDSFRTELRSTVQQLTFKVSEAVHAMCWLTWLAKYGPNKLSAERIELYDKEMHVLLPQIIGLHTILAGMDYAVFVKINTIVDAALTLDAQIGGAHLKFIEGDIDTATPLAGYHQMAVDLESQLAKVVAEAIKGYSINFDRGLVVKH
jgi:hypothetical protein